MALPSLAQHGCLDDLGAVLASAHARLGVEAGVLLGSNNTPESIASLPAEELQGLTEQVLACLRRIPGMTSLMANSGAGDEACVLSSSPRHVEGGTSELETEPLSHSFPVKQGQQSESFLDSAQALSLCSSALLLLAELERGRRASERRLAPSPATHDVEAKVITATSQRSLRREEGYVQLAMELQRRLLTGNAEDTVDLGCDEETQDDGANTAGPPALTHRREQVPGQQGDRHAVMASTEEEERHPHASAASSTASSLFGLPTTVPCEEAPPPRPPHETGSARTDTVKKSGSGAAVEALAATTGEQQQQQQKPLPAPVVPLAEAASAKGRTAEDGAATIPRAASDSFTSPLPSTSKASARAAQTAWTDTQLLQAALHRGIDAAGGGHMAMAANDFALIAKLLFKKCFVVEELVLNALVDDEEEEEGKDEEGNGSDGTAKGQRSGAHRDDDPPLLLNPDAITMSMLPPGLDDEDYEEERQYLEAKQQQNRQRADDVLMTSGASDLGSRSDGSLPATAWVLAALTKVDLDALPLSTLQTHCHLRLPTRYLRQQQQQSLLRRRQRLSMSGAATPWQPVNGDTDRFPSHPLVTNSDGSSLQPSPTSRVSSRQQSALLPRDSSSSVAGGEGDKGVLWRQSASAIESCDADPLAVLMPALKTTAAATSVVATRQQALGVAVTDDTAVRRPPSLMSSDILHQEQRPASGWEKSVSWANANNASPASTAVTAAAAASSSDFSLTALFAALLWNVAFTLWEDGYLEDTHQWLCALDLERLMAVAARIERGEKRQRQQQQQQQQQQPPDDEDPAEEHSSHGSGGGPGLRAYAPTEPAAVRGDERSWHADAGAQWGGGVEAATQRYRAVWRRASARDRISWERLLVCKRSQSGPSESTTSSPRRPRQREEASASASVSSQTNIVLPVGTTASVPLRPSGVSLVDVAASSGEKELLHHPPAAGVGVDQPHKEIGSTAAGAEVPQSVPDPGVGEEVAGEVEGAGDAESYPARSQALWSLAENIASLRDLCALAICCESSDDVLFLVRHIGAALEQLELGRRAFDNVAQAAEAADGALRAKACRPWQQEKDKGSEAFHAMCDDDGDDGSGAWSVIDKDACMADILLVLNLLVEFFLSKRARQLAAEYAQLEHKALASADSYYRQFGTGGGAASDNASSTHSTARNNSSVNAPPTAFGLFDTPSGKGIREATATAEAAQESAPDSGEGAREALQQQQQQREREQRAMVAACDELVCAFTAGFYYTLAELDQCGMPTPQEAVTILAPDVSYVLAMNVFSSTMNFASLFRLSKVYRGVVARESVYKNKSHLGRTARLRREQYMQQRQGGMPGYAVPPPPPSSGATTPQRSQPGSGHHNSSSGSSDGPVRGFFGFMREAATEFLTGVGIASSQGKPEARKPATPSATGTVTSDGDRSLAAEPPQRRPPQPPQRRSSFSLLGTPLEQAKVTGGEGRRAVGKESAALLPHRPQDNAKADLSPLRVDIPCGLFPRDPLDYTLVDWGCLPLPSQRKVTSSSAAALSSGPPPKRSLPPPPQQQSSSSSSWQKSQEDLQYLSRHHHPATADSGARSMSTGTAAATSASAIAVCGLYLLPEYASPLGRTKGVSGDGRRPTDTALRDDKQQDAALRLLLVLTRFRRRAVLEIIPAGTVDFVAQELNKAMHILQVELSKRKGAAWYREWKRRSHNEVHRFYTEALEEVQQLLPLPGNGDSAGERELAATATTVSPPSIPPGARLPYSPASQLPREHQQDHHLVSSASSTNASAPFPLYAAAAARATSPVEAAAAPADVRPVLHRNRNDHLLERVSHTALGAGDKAVGSSRGGGGGGTGIEEAGSSQGNGTGAFSTWWGRPLSIPTEAALRARKRNAQEAAVGADGEAYDRARKALSVVESLPVAWDAPPAFIPEVAIDFSAFTTTSLETQLATKRLVAEAIARQQQLEARCRTEHARRNVRQGGVTMLSAACRQLLHDELPMLQQYSNWRVIYSTRFHGVSMQTMLKSCQQEADAAAVRAGMDGLSNPFMSPTSRPMLLVIELAPSMSHNFTSDCAGVEEAVERQRQLDWEMEQRHVAAMRQARRASRTMNVNPMDPAWNDSRAAAPSAESGGGGAGEGEGRREGNEAKANAPPRVGANNLIIGAYLTDLLKMDSRRYYGGGETFVFQMLLPPETDDEGSDDDSTSEDKSTSTGKKKDHAGEDGVEQAREAAHRPRSQPSLRTYHSTGENNQYINCRLRSIVIGGGGGSALFLDDSLSKGASSACATFHSPPLTRWGDEHESGAWSTESMASFDVVQLEVIVMD